MYKIGEFSRFTNLTVKTLRYYDEAKILTPSWRDDTNGYRLYDENDYKKAELIIFLRKLDFSISEIKDVLENYESQNDLTYFLAEKKTQISKRINDDQNLICALEAYISQPKREEKIMNYEIQTKIYAPVLVASIRYQGKYEDTGKYFGKIFNAVKSKANGTPFNCYYDGEYKEDDADIEVCVPIKEPVTGNGVSSKRLPEMKAIYTTHMGSYDTLGDAYKALADYALEHNLKCKTPSREIYLKGPGMIFKGNPNKYVTEIAMEIE